MSYVPYPRSTPLTFIIYFARYVAGVTAEHANIMEGCNSLELYLVNFVLNKATNDYLMSCPANIYQARNPTPTDEVKAVTQCFSDLSTNMDAALTSPKYGFVDICEVTSTMTQCMGSAFRNAGMEPAIDWVVGQMNETHQAMVEFVKKECTASMLYLLIDYFSMNFVFMVKNQYSSLVMKD